MTKNAAVLSVDGGDLPLGGGLLALLRPALDRVDPGSVLALRSTAPALDEELRSFCRVEHHEYLGCERAADGVDVHLIARGALGVPIGEREQPSFLVEKARGGPGRIGAADLLAAVPMPERADSETARASGFAPRGARVEPGGPAYPFSLVERERVAPPEVAELYQHAVASQWDGTRDIAWEHIRPLPPALDAALSQVMTFLAENELSALYVPARFLPRIHPAYVETAMFLATQLGDEARHIDVFLKRARAGGGAAGISSVATSRSLLSLLQLEDFTEASFLLSVLGEGTFLDLLRYLEEHAPDEPTLDLLRRARADEARHVHFGLAHVRHSLARDPQLVSRLVAAVRRRAATLAGISSVPAPVADALTIVAARGDDPPSVRRGHERFRELLHTMHEGRLKRLQNAGFTAEQAQLLSDLHTPNFM